VDPAGVPIAEIPVDRTALVGDVEVTILSIETYPSAFTLRSRVSMLGSRDFGLETLRGPRGPEPAVDVTDDEGAKYAGRLVESGGSPREHRFTHRFEPALALRARRLWVRIPKISFVRFEAASPTYGTVEDWAGPWEFEIPLRA
jgi:hypothetical protein